MNYRPESVVAVSSAVITVTNISLSRVIPFDVTLTVAVTDSPSDTE